MSRTPQGTTPVMRKTVTHQNCIYSNRNVERQMISLCHIFYSNRKVVLSASYTQEVQVDIPIIILIGSDQIMFLIFLQCKISTTTRTDQVTLVDEAW